MVDMLAIDDGVDLDEELMWYGLEELMFSLVDETEWCALELELDKERA
jgi:hypothetical protein